MGYDDNNLAAFVPVQFPKQGWSSLPVGAQAILEALARLSSYRRDCLSPLRPPGFYWILFKRGNDPKPTPGEYQHSPRWTGNPIYQHNWLVVGTEVDFREDEVTVMGPVAPYGLPKAEEPPPNAKG